MFGIIWGSNGPFDQRLTSNGRDFMNLSKYLLAKLEHVIILQPSFIRELLVLRSAVGMTHVLRCGFVMGYATYQNPWIVLEYRLFPGVPSLNRLHSEIDQIHLSIEAQCDTNYLPLCDCHNWHKP